MAGVKILSVLSYVHLIQTRKNCPKDPSHLEKREESLRNSRRGVIPLSGLEKVRDAVCTDHQNHRI